MARRRPSMLAVTSGGCESFISHLHVHMLKTMSVQHNDQDTPQWTCSAVHTQEDIACDAATVVISSIVHCQTYNLEQHRYLLQLSDHCNETQERKCCKQ